MPALAGLRPEVVKLGHTLFGATRHGLAGMGTLAIVLRFRHLHLL